MSLPRNPTRGSALRPGQAITAPRPAMRRRRLIALGLVPLLAAAVSTPPASAAPSAATATTTTAPATTATTKATTATTATTTATAPTSAVDESLRSDLSAYAQGLNAAVTAASHNPNTAAQVSPKVADYMASLALAKAQIATLNDSQLRAVASILGTAPTWQSQPAALASTLQTVGPAPSPGPKVSPNLIKPAITFPFPGYLSSCTGVRGSLESEFYGYWAAAQVAAAANAVASGVPDGIEDTPILIIAAAFFGVANGIAIALQGVLNLDLDCATARFNGDLESTYPTDASVSGFTPASSQISVDALATIAGSVKMTLDNIEALLNGITSKLAGVINSLGIAQGTANTIQATAKDLQNRTDALLATVGTAADQTTGTANGLANTINARADTILANTATFQALSIRMEIERDLATANSPVEVLFALPASQGGYLETVRDIVATTIGNEVAAGQGIGTAQTFLSRGNTAFAANQYEAAFVQYALAYKAAVL